MSVAITLSTPSRNAAADAVCALANGGSLRLLAGASVLATFALANPAFAASSGGSAAASGLPLTATATGTGTADGYQVFSSASTLLWSGVVGSDLVLDNPNIATGQTISISAWTHTQPA